MALVRLLVLCPASSAEAERVHETSWNVLTKYDDTGEAQLGGSLPLFTRRSVPSHWHGSMQSYAIFLVVLRFDHSQKHFREHSGMTGALVYYIELIGCSSQCVLLLNYSCVCRFKGPHVHSSLIVFKFMSIISASSIYCIFLVAHRYWFFLGNGIFRIHSFIEDNAWWLDVQWFAGFSLELLLLTAIGLFQ